MYYGIKSLGLFNAFHPPSEGWPIQLNGISLLLEEFSHAAITIQKLTIHMSITRQGLV